MSVPCRKSPQGQSLGGLVKNEGGVHPRTPPSNGRHPFSDVRTRVATCFATRQKNRRDRDCMSSGMR
ncbi:hypothetical protein M406DRAFT_355028 [Cryphonectria parasitica EP155]|uniref:Uncharacterized protein n=1 Tax=Cryphonectria parasitica (strain ATCC 38755 / EP155) TaxID=660469 RepID=A0A9P4Y9H8_CRYP1|nr:uncharacterized protein M406DRAFT_355028 [Cryphonectria parasitica EP155]KAF3768807.1 hypothetical protein M406DRAFT_355028 [Cryphonectria parasitica EP155]